MVNGAFVTFVLNALLTALALWVLLNEGRWNGATFAALFVALMAAFALLNAVVIIARVLMSRTRSTGSTRSSGKRAA